MINEEIIDLESLSEDRYERQKRLPWFEQERLEKSRTLVVGAGTLGNEICKNLALIGVGEIWLIDIDIVERVNLNRSILMREDDIGTRKIDALKKHIENVNSDVSVYGINADVIWDVGAGFYKDFDVVISGLDGREARVYLNRYCYMVGTPLVDGAIEGLKGSVQVIMPPHTPCYECTFSDLDYKLLNIRYSCPGLPIAAMKAGKVPMIATTSSIIAGVQVQEALKIIHGIDSSLAGKKFYFDGSLNETITYSIKKRELCTGHYFLYDNDVSLVNSHRGIDQTAGELKNELKDKFAGEFNSKGEFNKDGEFNKEDNFTDINESENFNADNLKNGEINLMHDHEIAYGSECLKCGYKREFIKLLGRVDESDAICPGCGSLLRFDTSTEMKHDDITLRDYCVPHFAILRARYGDNFYFISLNSGRDDILRDLG